MDKELCISIDDLLITCTAITVILLLFYFLLQQRNEEKIQKLRDYIQEITSVHQKELFQVITKAQEEEKRNLGRNLHDDLSGSLAALRLTIDMASFEYMTSLSFDAFKIICKNLIDGVIKKVRSISHNLSLLGLETDGLFESVKEMVEQVNNTGTLKISVSNTTGNVLSRLSPAAELAIFRVLEELLTNTIKHARATYVTIDFSMNGTLPVIRYADNGQGLPVHRPRGMGLLNIENRLNLLDAAYRINSNPGKGFSIEITLKNL